MSGTKQKAIQIQSQGVAKVVSDAAIPTPQKDEILVKVGAVALNPTDWKHIDYLPTAGATVGCDYSGIVKEVGSDVNNVKVGDRVAGVTHGSNKVKLDDGCFSEYAVGLAYGSAKLPQSWSITDGSTLGISVTTVGQGVCQSLGVPLPDTDAKAGTPLLIYGGSTATGIYAIQYAKLSGCKIAVTCSPHNNELMKSLGADETFDYSDPEVGKKIRNYFNDELKLAFDPITNEGSVKICSDAIGSKGGKYSGLSPPPAKPRDDVEYTYTLAYTGTGRKFKMGDQEVPAKPEDAEFAAKFWKITDGLLAEGKLTPIKTDVRNDGLEGVLDGLKDLKEGKVSGKKIVYVVDPSIK